MAVEKKLDMFKLEELIEMKKNISAIIKEKKAELKELEKKNTKEASEYAKGVLKVGDRIVFKYKDAEAEGVVQKLNEKTFTVAFEFEGEDKVSVRAYNLFIKYATEFKKVA
jgi:S-adenosylmethionine:tRNA-ribosyltransferase-isomerase (queuine synthetase)